MHFGQLIDAAEAALVEPHLHGAAATVDEVLNKFEAKVREMAAPDDETWIDSDEAQAQAELLEQMMPPTFIPPPVPHEEETSEG